MLLGALGAGDQLERAFPQADGGINVDTLLLALDHQAGQFQILGQGGRVRGRRAGGGEMVDQDRAGVVDAGGVLGGAGELAAFEILAVGALVEGLAVRRGMIRHAIAGLLLPPVEQSAHLGEGIGELGVGGQVVELVRIPAGVEEHFRRLRSLC